MSEMKPPDNAAVITQREADRLWGHETTPLWEVILGGHAPLVRLHAADPQQAARRYEGLCGITFHVDPLSVQPADAAAADVVRVEEEPKLRRAPAAAEAEASRTHA